MSSNSGGKNANNPVTGKGTAKVSKNSRTRHIVESVGAKWEEKTLLLTDIQRDDDLFGCRLKRDKATVEKYLILHRDNMEAEAMNGGNIVGNWKAFNRQSMC